jgi:hypothetical protein
MKAHRTATGPGRNSTPVFCFIVRSADFLPVEDRHMIARELRSSSSNWWSFQAAGSDTSGLKAGPQDPNQRTNDCLRSAQYIADLTQRRVHNENLPVPPPSR